MRKVRILLILLVLALAMSACVITGGDPCTVSTSGLNCPTSDYNGGW